MNPPVDPSFWQALPRLLPDRRSHWVVLTGAGSSKESGIPTFREAQSGLWERFRPEELASAQGFEKDPLRVWKWYQHRRHSAERAAPHAGHRVLSWLEKTLPSLAIITQNVDGLHQRAGSREVIELHGSLHRSICYKHRHPAHEGWAQQSGHPKCRECGSWLRPDVVWFGENLCQATLQRASEAAKQAKVFFVIGTSSQVYPAAGLAWMAKAAGATLVEINPECTPLRQEADFFLPMKASVALEMLKAQLLRLGGQTFARTNQ